MISKTTKRFRASLEMLPTAVRRKATIAYRLFRDDPHHRSLHFKKVHPTEPIYSARVTVNVRAVGVLDDDTIVWFWIGNHADYEELLKRL